MVIWWNILAFIAPISKLLDGKFVGVAELCNVSLMLALYCSLDVYMEVLLDHQIKWYV
jgi:hypothetical protein